MSKLPLLILNHPSPIVAIPGHIAYNHFLLLDKTADNVSGGAWGRRPHTLSEPALLVS
jgi:hypothetical protein